MEKVSAEVRDGTSSIACWKDFIAGEKDVKERHRKSGQDFTCLSGAKLVYIQGR